MQDTIPGFVTGVVTSVEDPTGTGRIKVKVPGLIEPETSYWVMPAQCPGSGTVGEGSQYMPPPLNSPVFVSFMYGRYEGPTCKAIYWVGFQGLDPDTGASAGPACVSEAATAAKARQRTCLVETASLRIYIVDETDDKRIVIESKATGSKIELDATGGTSKKGEVIRLEARTGIEIFSYGLIDIQGTCGVQINGRRVASLMGGNI